MKGRGKLVATHRVVACTRERVQGTAADAYIPINLRNVAQGCRYTLTLEATSQLQLDDLPGEVTVMSRSLLQAGSYHTREKGESTVLGLLHCTGQVADPADGSAIYLYAVPQPAPTIEINAPSILQGSLLHLQLATGTGLGGAPSMVGEWTAVLRFDVYE